MWISCSGDTYVCTTVELISSRTESNKPEDYIHKFNGRPLCEEKNDLKL